MVDKEVNRDLEARVTAMNVDKALDDIGMELSTLLPKFDKLMLCGYSQEKDQAYERDSTPIYSIARILRTADDIRKFFNELDVNDREEFLYGLRKALLEAQGAVQRVERERTRVLGAIEPMRKAMEKSGQRTSAISSIVGNYEEERRIVVARYHTLYNALGQITKYFGHVQISL
jgi:hypothetical protein